MLGWSFARCGCGGHGGLNPGRRRLLGGALAGAVGLAAGSAPRAAPAGPRPIDVHHHYFPQAQKEATDRYYQRPSRPNAWTVARSLEEMDRVGVAASLLSLQLPGVWLGGVENSRRLARTCNEEGAQIVRDNPARFGLMAAIAPPDPAGAVLEIDHAYDVLKVDGIGLMTSYDGKYLGDPAFAPVLAHLNARKAVIFVHPTIAPCCFGLVPGVDEGTVEYTAETTRTMASLLFARAPQRYPAVRWIFAHSGGTFPFLSGRMLREAARQSISDPEFPLPDARRFFYEIAQGTTRAQLAAVMETIPKSQLLFGTDYPFRPAAEAVEGLGNYPFTAAERASLLRGQAERLFPRLSGSV